MLGFVWSMLTPIAMVAIFSFVFTRVFRSPMPDFPVFFLGGFLSWQYFSNSLTGSVGAIVGNGELIKKIYFPREVLPAATVLSQGVHFILSLAVFSVYMALVGYNPLAQFHILVLAFVLQTVFNLGIAMTVASANVGFRDLQELLAVILLIWFYGSPIIYSLDMVPEPYRGLLMLNPMTWFIGLYRQALYFLDTPSLELLGSAAGVSILSLTFGYALFSRLSMSFAKEV